MGGQLPAPVCSFEDVLSSGELKWLNLFRLNLSSNVSYGGTAAGPQTTAVSGLEDRSFSSLHSRSRMEKAVWGRAVS